MIAAATLLAAAVTALPGAGERPNAEYTDYLAAYARCTVRERHDEASRAVLSELGADDLERKFDDLFIARPVAHVERCKELVIRDGVAIPLRGEVLRMALAEELVRVDLHRDVTVSFADRAPLVWRDMPNSSEAFGRQLASVSGEGARKRLQDRYTKQVAQYWLWRVGECVVRRDPTVARNWLLSRPASAEGSSIAQSLTPALGACLPEGRQVTFSKDTLRGTIAVNYYRLARAPTVAVAGAAK